MKYKNEGLNGRNASSEEVSSERLYSLLYKISSDIERLDMMVRTIKRQTEVKNGNEQ